MNLLNLGLAASALSLLAFDQLYRATVIRPRTNLLGHHAAYIEVEHFHRWLWPVLSGTVGPHDILFAGNSHFMDGIDPVLVERDSGWRAYNLACYNVSSSEMAELVVFYNLSPRLVVLDICTSYSEYRGLAATRNFVEPRVVDYRQQAEAVLADHMEWIFPYFFTPQRFRPAWRRIARSLVEYHRTRIISLKRYTPFRPFISFEWSLDKRTNHRVVRRLRAKASRELATERANIDRVKAGMAKACPIGTPQYQNSLSAVRRIVNQMIDRGIQVVFCRMPLAEEIVQFENQHFAGYFNDMQSIAREYESEYFDLTAAPYTQRLGELGFYVDGQHLLQPSAERVSHFVAMLLRPALQRGSAGLDRAQAKPKEQNAA